MISWALKRNSDSARDAPVSDDTTQIDLPDTPAPVFAVRALKTAIFGTPAPRDRRPVSKTAKDKTTAPSTENSPAKPPGILLTPGTGTSRRKRVSFGHDVKQGSAGTARTSTTGLPDECPGKFPSPWVDKLEEAAEPRPKTRLQQAMESSRKNHHSTEAVADENDAAPPAREPEDVWEEVEDESDFEADITMDLNEPHSRSGKYWKSYFETYHTDAKTEMEKLVKYKHLAKSYAKMKDTEAVQLNQRLQEEQDKVKALEEKVAEMARQAALGTRRKGGGESDLVLVEELKKQTALVAEYKLQVEELEALLQDNINELGDGRQQRRNASPRTQRTLMETQRELRRARSQARELEKLQEERDRLRSDLKFAEQRAGKLAEENRKLSGEVSQSTSRIQDLEKRLEDSKGLYEKLKDDAKSRYVEAQQVLKKRNEKILELQEEVEALNKGEAESKRATRSTRAKSFDEKSTSLKFLETAEEGSARLFKGLEALKKRNNLRGTASTAVAAPTETRQRDKRGAEPPKRTGPHDDATLAQARALREKLEAEFGTKGLPASSAVFSDRGNLQDSQSSASSGRSAHSRGSQEDDAHAHAHEPKPRRPARSTWAPTTAEKATLEDLLSDKRGRRASLELGQARKAGAAPPRPSSRGSDTTADVGATTAANAQSTVVWNTANAPRPTSIPEHRRTAALARIQRRIAERKLLQQLGRDKENARPESPSPTLPGHTHFLLLLSDSALPLGSFAFSSGLESYLAHQKPSPYLYQQHPASFTSFLPLSLSSYASTTLPFVLAAHRNPSLANLAALDDALDAAIVCTVGRRASVAQGRALLGIWERSFAGVVGGGDGAGGGRGREEAREVMRGFAALLRSSSSTASSPDSSDDPPPVSAHLAPLFGAVCALAGLDTAQTAYVFMLGHTKALVSAAVRAGVFGPYQAQKTLAGGAVQGLLAAVVEREWTTTVEEAGQCVPVMDLWVGRHEVLYSRIFNS
ncbi:putative urease accessory protein UreF-like protein [Staphylotrichum tortipilum]|uniref:Urease accessory protein UreF-like protein n=1 Tax=Staphylotrichum tortipilum TaxID=2831512 RepID=A0AAN6MRZ7_9PEZI|nr:putative urease accessory protein UreF-like protein [Staphylotrichum longicolle]